MAQAPAPNYFDSYTANTSGLSCMIRIIAGKFVVTIICESCKKKHAPHAINAADNNLARAVAFALDQHRKHLQDLHK